MGVSNDVENITVNGDGTCSLRLGVKQTDRK